MERIVYYSDERSEDFASTNGKIDRSTVDGSYRYSHRSVWWKIGAFIAYRLFATPLVALYTWITLGLRVKNRRAMKQCRGCFLYLNHTQNICDAFIPSLASFPKRAYIITGPEAVSIKGIRVLVAMLGAIPLPSRFSAARSFEARLRQAIDEGAVVTVYPEAHIWPWCNFVRDFSEKSFSYPYKTGAPVIAGVVVYRRRKVFKKLPPLADLILSDPIMPDLSLSEKAARKKLRDEAYRFMTETAKEQNSYAYIQYIKKAP